VPESENHIATVQTALGRDEVVARLTALSKKGKLAGFERDAVPGNADAAFAAHGNPFDGQVLVRAGDGSVHFDLHMPRKWTVILGVVLVLTVWPGLPITDGFLQNFDWYARLTAGRLDTWMWYLPLTVIPAPFMLRSTARKSRVSAAEHARETVERVAESIRT
jgi:hypothetical protein